MQIFEYISTITYSSSDTGKQGMGGCASFKRLDLIRIKLIDMLKSQSIIIIKDGNPNSENGSLGKPSTKKGFQQKSSVL